MGWMHVPDTVFITKHGILRDGEEDKGKSPERAEHVETAEFKPEDSKFPVLGKEVKENALPFIPAEEVRRRNGKGAARLCK